MRVRYWVSAGIWLLAMLGLYVPFPGSNRLSVFTKSRFESTTDYWKKRGEKRQYNQIGGINTIAGLHVRFRAVQFATSSSPYRPV